MAWTNKGKFKAFDVWLRGTAGETNLFVALLTSAGAVVADTNTMADVTQVATGNGYTDGGGTEGTLSRNSTDFDVLTEDDTNDRALIQIKDIVWTANTGNLPSSGAARYAALTDDNVTVSAREIYAGWDLGSDRVVSATQTLTLQNLELRIT